MKYVKKIRNVLMSISIALIITDAVGKELPYGAAIDVHVNYPAKDERALIFEVILQNQNQKALCVASPRFPSERQRTKLFTIYEEDGKELKYTGILSDKSGPITDYVIIPPGTMVKKRVNVGKDYAFKSGKRKYFVSYQVKAYSCGLFNNGYVERWDGKINVDIDEGEYFIFRALEIPFEY